MGLLGYFVYRSLSLLLGQRFIGFLRFSLLRLTSPYFSAYWISPLLQCLLDFSAFILLGWLLRLLDQCFLDFSAFIYSAYWIFPLLFTVLIGFLRFYLLWLTSPIAGSVLLLDFSAYIYLD